MEADELREVEDLLSRGSTARFGRRGRKSLYEAPEFTKRLSAFTEADAGNDVKFECQYKGFPRPTLRWYRDDELVAGDERYIFEEADGFAGLSITRVGKYDEAAYKCKAENSEGVTSTTGYLSVTGDLTDKPLSCQGRQSDHAVSNPPPLRTIIEQKSMEEREEDSYPQPSTSPVDEILEEAAMKGHGWPAMLGLKKKRGKRQRLPNEEDYDSGSDTSVESQQEDRINHEHTPDADLVIDEANLFPDDGQLLEDESQMMQTKDNIDPSMHLQDEIIANGTAMAEQVISGAIAVVQQMNQEMSHDSGSLQEQGSNEVCPMDINAVDPASEASAACQVPLEEQNNVQEFQSQPEMQSKNGFEEQQNPMDYSSQVAENSIMPEMQTAPAMASPMEFTQPLQEAGQEVVQAEQMQTEPPQEIQAEPHDKPQPQEDVQTELEQTPKAEPNLQEHALMTQGEIQPVQIEESAAEVPATVVQVSLVHDNQSYPQPEGSTAPEFQQETESQFRQAPEGTNTTESQPGTELAQSPEGATAVELQPETKMAQSSDSVLEEPRDESPMGTYKPGTEKQKSLESGYSTEDLDAAIHQDAAATFTETVQVPVVGGQRQSENVQQSTIVLGDAGQTTPEVTIGSPVNLQVSLTGQAGQVQLGDMPIGIQVQGMHPQVLEQGNVVEPDGVVQQAPPEVVAQPNLASPQVYESPVNSVSLESEVRCSPPHTEQEPDQVQYVSSVSSEITEPQVMPQSTEAVMSRPVEQLQSQEMIDEENSYSSASNPFRSPPENSNEEMLVSYTRTFSSTVDEEENAQEVSDPLNSCEPIVTRRHSDEIITLARVETTRPFHDWLPFPWLPASLLVTVSSFLAVAFEISPSTFVLAVFFISLISFRFITRRVEPKED